MFNKEVYVRRRAELRDRLAAESGLVIFVGNIESPCQYRDNCYKWRQDSSWLYFFGLEEPRFAATMDLDSGVDTIYADDFSLDDIIWMGPMPTVASLAAECGISATAPYADFDKTVLNAVAKGRKVHFLPVSREYNAIKISSLLGFTPEEAFTAGKRGCAKASEALTRAVIGMRLVKRPEEIVELDKAGDLGFRMHTTARKGIRPGRIEQEIVGEMEAVCTTYGWGISFATILTQHGEIFHCHTHQCEVQPGKLMVVDAGAEIDSHYASDFTRTYPTSGKFTQKQRDIYQTVHECNELAFSLCRPGVPYVDIHKAVCRHILDNLSQIGLVSGDLDEMVEDGVAGLFMPHGLGHNLGLDVHDMEDYGENLVGYGPGQSRSSQLGLGSLRMARPLVPGNLVTDEPGIYFIPALIESCRRDGVGKGRINYGKLESYYDFGGIRLEDDVLITEDGARRTGERRLPISPDEIETAMAED